MVIRMSPNRGRSRLVSGHAGDHHITPQPGTASVLLQLGVVEPQHLGRPEDTMPTSQLLRYQLPAIHGRNHAPLPKAHRTTLSASIAKARFRPGMAPIESLRSATTGRVAWPNCGASSPAVAAYRSWRGNWGTAPLPGAGQRDRATGALGSAFGAPARNAGRRFRLVPARPAGTCASARRNTFVQNRAAVQPVVDGGFGTGASQSCGIFPCRRICGLPAPPGNVVVANFDDVTLPRMSLPCGTRPIGVELHSLPLAAALFIGTFNGRVPFPALRLMGL